MEEKYNSQDSKEKSKKTKTDNNNNINDNAGRIFEYSYAF